MSFVHYNIVKNSEKFNHRCILLHFFGHLARICSVVWRMTRSIIWTNRLAKIKKTETNKQISNKIISNKIITNLKCCY